jgi:hypothetical protein
MPAELSLMSSFTRKSAKWRDSGDFPLLLWTCSDAGQVGKALPPAIERFRIPEIEGRFAATDADDVFDCCWDE